MQNKIVHATEQRHHYAKQRHHKEFSNFSGCIYDTVKITDRSTNSSFKQSALWKAGGRAGRQGFDRIPFGITTERN
jgi:hypothetical protein